MRLCPLAQWRVGEAQEADEVDRGDLKGNHERRELGEGPPRTGGESLDPEAARFPRPLPKEALAVERDNFAGKEGAEREEGQHQGTQRNFALSLQTTRAVRPGGL